MKTTTLTISVLTVALLFAFGATGCQKPRPTTKDDQKAGASSMPKEAPAESAAIKNPLSTSKVELSDEEKALVVAKIDDVTITLGDFQARLDSLPSYVKLRYSSLAKKKEFLHNMVEFEVLAAEAKKLGYDKDPAVIFALKQKMIDKLLEKDVANLVKVSDVTDEEMKAYYEANLTIYQKPERRRASQIVLPDEATAKEVLGKLEAAIAGDTKKVRKVFNSFVKEYSQDTKTKAINGDLHFFDAAGAVSGSSKSVCPAVATAVFGLDKLNTLTGPIQCDGSWVIVLYTNRRPPIDKGFEDVKGQIQNKLFRKMKEEARKQYIEELKGKATVEVVEEPLMKLPTTKPQVPAPGKPGASLDKMMDPTGQKAIKIPPTTAIDKKKAKKLLEGSKAPNTTVTK